MWHLLIDPNSRQTAWCRQFHLQPWLRVIEGVVLSKNGGLRHKKQLDVAEDLFYFVSFPEYAYAIALCRLLNAFAVCSASLKEIYSSISLNLHLWSTQLINTSAKFLHSFPSSSWPSRKCPFVSNGPDLILIPNHHPQRAVRSGRSVKCAVSTP
jgi:hypothetical protein